MRSLSDYVSTRALNVDASGIRKVFDLAAKMPDPINLSIGLPHFDVPNAVKAAAIASIEAGQNRYTQTQGIAPLRERLRADLSREMGRDVGDVLITSGVSGGLLLAILATINPGDEVIFLDPYFVMYKHLLTMAGGVAVPVDTYPDFRFPAERVAAAVTPRTKLLVLNSPSNPTGVVMTQAEIDAAVAVAREHGLIIISDEIYEPFLYASAEGAVLTAENGDRTKNHSAPSSSLSTQHSALSTSTARLPSAGRHYDRTLILRGFSKSHAMTGWRLGYAAGPAEILSQMAKLQQYTYVCAPSPLQYAALTALDVPMHDAVAAYRQKRDIVFDGLRGKFKLVKPEGAFYLFPQAPAGSTASEFVAKAIANNVLIIPGNVFSERDTHFRVSYATTDEKLRQGVEVLNRLA